MKPKDYSEFNATLHLDGPDSNWTEALQSVWYEAKGDWDASHNIAQELHTNAGSWIHAYLHRKEGDKWNAGYWYRQAQRPFPNKSLEAEVEDLVNYILTE